MEISTINTAATTQDGTSRIPVQTLGQEDFLKLMVAQLSQQDPLNPQKDTEFIAQMASFSALEQSKAMQSDIAKMRLEQQFLQANNLIGRVVALQDEGGALVSGIVSGVSVQEGIPKLVVNEQAYDLSMVLSVVPAPTNTVAQGVQL